MKWYEYRIYSKDIREFFDLIKQDLEDGCFHFFEPNNELRLRVCADNSLQFLEKLASLREIRNLPFYEVLEQNYEGERNYYNQYWDEFLQLFITQSKLGRKLFPPDRWFVFRRATHCLSNQIGLTYLQEGYYHFRMILRCLKYGFLEKLNMLKT